MLEVRHRFLVGCGQPSMLILVRSAAALATMRPVLLMRVLMMMLRRKQRGGPVNREVAFFSWRLALMFTKRQKDCNFHPSMKEEGARWRETGRSRLDC